MSILFYYATDVGAKKRALKMGFEYFHGDEDWYEADLANLKEEQWAWSCSNYESEDSEINNEPVWFIS